ncbi:MAG: helix-turn-helix domain-containing protein [Defluviitaleaceae bacterium]|nr:helix-turn-helix domain-containing protein [Defluviitaleaceae bacterium]
MLSQTLVDLRKKRGFTHDYVAEYLKITRQAYSFYESGKREMNFESLCMLADLYNVTTDYLLGRSDVTNSPFDDEEIGIIRTYRNLDQRAKETVKNILSFEASLAPKVKDTKKSVM